MGTCEMCSTGGSWSVLIKPTHGCNFNCKYCYDAPYRQKYKNTTMSMETLNEILKRAAAYADSLQLIWHGGEPLLVGKQWYEDAQKVIAMYPELDVEQSMQSNGSLLDREWAELSNKYNIDIGVSFDGPHQSVRDSRYEEVEASIKEFRGAGGKCGFICVINHENYDSMIETYEYFKTDMKSNISFNRVFDTIEARNNGLNIEVDDYLEKFREFYEYWAYDVNGVEERTVIEFTNHLFGLGTGICSFGDCRGKWLGFNPVGDIYPCDRYVPDKYKVGNIRDFSTVQDAYASDSYMEYYDENTIRMLECIECDYFNTCGGGCNANHITYAGDASKNDPKHCETYKKSFRDVYEFWREIDLEDRRFNLIVSDIIIDNDLFVPKEIVEMVHEIDPDIEIKYDSDVDNLQKSSEFKLFRLVNPITKTGMPGEYHIDYISKEIPISVMKEDPKIFTVVKEAREKFLREFVKSNIDKIREIASEGV